MPDAPDMTAPVTRAELRTEIDRVDRNIDLTRAELRTEIDRVDRNIDLTRTELRTEIDRVDRNIDLTRTELDRVDKKLDLTRTELERSINLLSFKFDEKLELWGGALIEMMKAMEQRLFAEMARHAGALQEAFAGSIAVVDQKYADLPARVTRLENRAVKRTRRR